MEVNRESCVKASCDDGEECGAVAGSGSVGESSCEQKQEIPVANVQLECACILRPWRMRAK